MGNKLSLSDVMEGFTLKSPGVKKIQIYRVRLLRVDLGKISKLEQQSRDSPPSRYSTPLL